jgi:hypothetical protein
MRAPLLVCLHLATGRLRARAGATGSKSPYDTVAYYPRAARHNVTHINLRICTHDQKGQQTLRIAHTEIQYELQIIALMGRGAVDTHLWQHLNVHMS